MPPPIDRIASILTTSLSTQRTGTMHISHARCYTPVWQAQCFCKHFPCLKCPLSAYLGSDVLKRPNAISTALVISNTSDATEHDGRSPRLVNDKAFERAAKYLWDLLGRLRSSKRFPPLMAISAPAAFNGLKQSLEAYTRRMWPHAHCDSKFEPRLWWKNLANEDSAFILSVSARCFRLLVCHGGY